MHKNNNGIKRKARRGGKKNIQNQIKIAKTLIGSTVEKIVQFNETITSVSGTALPAWSSSSDNGIYIYSRFFLAADFTEMAAVYQRCKIQKIRVTISRTYTETTGITIYPSGIPQLRVGFFPALTPTITNTDIIDLESAMILQPYAVSPVTKDFPVIDITTLDGAGGVALSMGRPFDTSAIPSLTPRGVFGCGWKTIGNAASDAILYDVRFQFLCRFDVPY